MKWNKLTYSERFTDFIIILLFFPVIFALIIYTIFKSNKSDEKENSNILFGWNPRVDRPT